MTHNGKTELVNATTALSVAYAIKEQFEKDGISFKNVLFWATDGASVMLGTQSGVSFYLKLWTSKMALNYHCVAHKHALALNHAALKPFAEWLEGVMKRIVSYYARSGQRKQHLKQIQDELGLARMNMLKFHAIRWLSRSAVLTRIVKNYPALRVMWERETRLKNTQSDVSVSQLVHDTETHKFLGSLYSICDILYQQAEINTEFQRKVV